MSKSSIHIDIADILQLIEILPINNRLEIDINTKVPIDKSNLNIARRLNLENDSISFIDIVKLLIKFIAGIYPTRGSDKEQSIPYKKLEELQKIGSDYASQYLLFDFCLAALEGDLLDAKLFLGHAINIIELNNQLSLLLSAIVYTPLTNNSMVRELLALLALEIQPTNIDSFIELYGDEFQKRYETYENELMKINI